MKKIRSKLKKPLTPKELLESWTNESFGQNGNPENHNGISTEVKNLEPIDFWDNEEEDDDNHLKIPEAMFQLQS